MFLIFLDFCCILFKGIEYIFCFFFRVLWDLGGCLFFVFCLESGLLGKDLFK